MKNEISNDDTIYSSLTIDTIYQETR